MKHHGMIFNAEMVRAILDGRKTQTRRMVKLPLKDPMFGCEIAGCEINGLLKDGYSMGPIRVGDIIWVRETWAAVDWCDKSKPSDFGSAVWYQATNSGPHAAAAIPYKTDKRGKWRPSIHMPRWASRIDLEVTAVRVERLQDISEEDARREGVKPTAPIYGDCGGHAHEGHKDAFRTLWQSIYANWETNPLVWVREFRRVK